MKIVFDLDGVLLDFCSTFSKFVQGQGGPLLDTNPNRWGWGPELHESLKPMYKAFEDSGDYKNMPLIDSSAPLALAKACAHHEVLFYSAAPPEQVEERKMNLARLGIYAPNLVCDRDKITTIITTVKPDLCFEDSPENISRLLTACYVCGPKFVRYVPMYKSKYFSQYESLGALDWEASSPRGLLGFD